MKRVLIIVIFTVSTSCFMIKGGNTFKEELYSYRFQRLDGGYSTISEYSGDIYILYFFTSYCLPCIADLNFFKQNKNHFSENKIVLIGIGMDYNREITLKPFVEYNKIDFPVMIADKNIINGDWTFKRITTIPTSILINKKERRYIIHIGNLSEDIIKQIK